MKKGVDILFYGLWLAVFITALIVQAIPIYFVVMIFSLAIGVPIGAAVTVMPIFFIAMLYLSCLIASKLTMGPATAPKSGSPDNRATAADRYRDMRRFG